MESKQELAAEIARCAGWKELAELLEDVPVGWIAAIIGHRTAKARTKLRPCFYCQVPFGARELRIHARGCVGDVKFLVPAVLPVAEHPKG